LETDAGSLSMPQDKSLLAEGEFQRTRLNRFSLTDVTPEFEG